MAIFCYEYYVLPLATGYARSMHGPAVVPLDIPVPSAHHQNRLYRESHSWSHLSSCSVLLSIVMHERRKMKLMSDSMSTKFFVYRKTFIMCVIFNFRTNLGKLCSWFTNFNGFKHRLSSHLRQPFYVRMNITE